MIKNHSENPDAQMIKRLAEDLIREQTTMTLATAKSDIAWAAPVYYVYLKASFYFFSDPHSRHIKESIESQQAASAIFAFADTWKEIRGLQMSGNILSIPPGVEAIDAIRTYLKKYPFTKEFIKPGESMDLRAFTKRFRVKLYAFKPSTAYYLDNQIRFGFKETVDI